MASDRRDWVVPHRPTEPGLEVFDLRVIDEPPAGAIPATRRARRWHLWHRWSLVRVDAHTSYVGCDSCGRLRTPTLFEPPVP